ncbi:MAG: hypothetical protein AAFR24_17055, partial [Cyanobacteria bacterium J06627_3]
MIYRPVIVWQPFKGIPAGVKELEVWLLSQPVATSQQLEEAHILQFSQWPDLVNPSLTVVLGVASLFICVLIIEVVR